MEPNKERALKSKRRENQAAKRLGGRRIAASGARPWSRYDRALDMKFGCGGKATTARGDIRTTDLHVEHKRTEKGSISVKLEWLLKVTAGAVASNRDPMLMLEFERGVQPPVKWIAVPLDVWERCRDAASKGEGEGEDK